jgi:hypothetical protein
VQIKRPAATVLRRAVPMAATGPAVLETVPGGRTPRFGHRSGDPVGHTGRRRGRPGGSGRNVRCSRVSGRLQIAMPTGPHDRGG